MRDFRAGRDIHVGGNVHIYDQSHQRKLLVECTNEELYTEQQHRKGLLAEEKRRKLKYLAVLTLMAAAILGGFAVGSYIKGYTEQARLLLPLASLVIAMQGVRIWKHPTEFEQRQLAALQEISMILRERN